MLFKDDDKPPTSKDEAQARRVRPPPERYDPDKLSHWSITMTLARIIWREIDAVRNEWDDYRNECADWILVPTARAKLVIPDLQKDLKESPWHLHQWKPSGWNELCLRARLENMPPQDAIDALWQAAGEGRIKATALQCENGKALHGDRIEIPAHHWPHLKRVDDPLTGKAMLSDDNGRVYREVEFRQLDVKELWPKSPPPLSGEHAETGPSHLALIQLIESTTWTVPFHRSEVDALENVEKPEPEQTRPAEPESPTPAPASKRERPQAERAKRYIEKNFPSGTDGITTVAIHSKLKADEDLQAELKQLGGAWDVPSPTEINRVLGRRKA